MTDKVWDPFDPITHITVRVDPSVIWPLGYEPQEEYEVPARAGKFYQRAHVAAREEKNLQTKAQKRYNQEHSTCGSCKGRGTLKRHDNVGCPACNGTGAVAS